MPRGGKRPGAGRPRGTGNRTKRSLPPPANAAEVALREHVALCAATGMQIADIAAVLAVPEVELRAKFEHELAHGAAIVRAAQLASLSAAAAKGNSSAAKALLNLIQRNPADESALAETPDDDFMKRTMKIFEEARNR